MPDQYTRTRAQLGTPALDVLRRAHVAVFGIGGVGGQAVEVLARSGVGELSLFDSDTVALSNLNRQLGGAALNAGAVQGRCHGRPHCGH